MIRYEEFRMEDVLDWQPQKEIDPLKIRDLSVDSDVKYPFYGQATINNGIISFLSLSDTVLNNQLGKPTILIHSNNQNIVYLETPFYLKDGHGATSVLQSEHLNEKTALYIMACIRKVIANKYSYNEKATKIALKNTMIRLPVTAMGKIDYAYMSRYVSELEEERVSRLSAYLKACCLQDYTLSASEQDALDRYRQNRVNHKIFTIGELFDIRPTKSYGYTNRVLFRHKGSTPVVVNSSINNGIGGYVSLEPTELGNIITYTDTTTSEGIFYQPHDFVGYSHIQGLYPKHGMQWTENSLLYFLTLFKKQAAGRFDYANKFTRKIAKKMIVELPLSEQNKIDFDFMENFVKAQKKLSIKNVVDWKNRTYPAAEIPSCG